ncbi:MAG TPA: hypothetical protein VMF11_00075 [Candidatus Baltobacteraceae bacterium]|nr:hypothetical protein [Candidatus Baltobacteraceae bacterium]
MRRLLALFALFASALLIAATPKLHPLPMPSATPPPSAVNKPVVLIYPFEAPPDLNQKYGTAIAQIYAQVMAQTGGVTVLQIPTGILREDYQKFAHVQHADYYVSGYIQPIGQGAAIVAQVVDVASDISVYSATTNISDVQDVASQALTARTVILQAAGIDRPEINTGPADTPTPSSTAGASVPITSVLTDLFKGKPKVAKAGPTATPEPAKPPRGVLIVHPIGNAGAKVLSAGADDLYRALDARFNTTMTSVVSTDVAKAADSICGTHRDNTVVSGVLNVTHVGGFRPHDSYTFTLNVYACFGAVLYTDTQTNDNYARAIHDAVEAYYTNHPANDG